MGKTGARMAQVAYWSVLVAIAFGVLTSSGDARAGDNKEALRDLLADCGGPSVSPSDIDGCLERAREIDETSPSPQLQSLLAKLERQAEDADSDDSSPRSAVDAPPANATPAPVKSASSQDDPPAGPP